MGSIDTYQYLSIIVPEVSILIATSLYRYFPSLVAMKRMSNDIMNILLDLHDKPLVGESQVNIIN